MYFHLVSRRCVSLSCGDFHYSKRADYCANIQRIKESVNAVEKPVDREKFFNDPNIAILATTGPGRRAHAIPIWYLYEDGHFIMVAGANSQKVRNIERQGEATLTIDRREPPYYAAMVRGAAEIGPPMSDDTRLRLAVRYLGEEMGRAFTAQRTGGNSVSIHLQPDYIIEYQGVAGRFESRP